MVAATVAAVVRVPSAPIEAAVKVEVALVLSSLMLLPATLVSTRPSLASFILAVTPVVDDTSLKALTADARPDALFAPTVKVTLEAVALSEVTASEYTPLAVNLTSSSVLAVAVTPVSEVLPLMLAASVCAVSAVVAVTVADFRPWMSKVPPA